MLRRATWAAVVLGAAVFRGVVGILAAFDVVVTVPLPIAWG